MKLTCSHCGNSDYTHKKDNGICPNCRRPMFDPYFATLEVPGICELCGGAAVLKFVVLRPKKSTQIGKPCCKECAPKYENYTEELVKQQAA